MLLRDNTGRGVVPPAGAEEEQRGGGRRDQADVAWHSMRDASRRILRLDNSTLTPSSLHQAAPWLRENTPLKLCKPIFNTLQRTSQETCQWFLEVVDSRTAAALCSIRTSSPCSHCPHESVCCWISAAFLHVQPLDAQEQMFPGWWRACGHRRTEKMGRRWTSCLWYKSES